MFLSEKGLEETPKAEPVTIQPMVHLTPPHICSASIPLWSRHVKGPWDTVGTRKPIWASAGDWCVGMEREQPPSAHRWSDELQSWRDTWLSLWASTHLSSCAPLHPDLSSTVAHSVLLTEGCRWLAKESILGPDKWGEELAPLSPWGKSITQFIYKMKESPSNNPQDLPLAGESTEPRVMHQPEGQCWGRTQLWGGQRIARSLTATEPSPGSGSQRCMGNNHGASNTRVVDKAQDCHCPLGPVVFL